ncbi:MAG: BlaB/IND/MUS family subclass B1 metallo-beta-lactamase [Lacibacter sp.]
MRFIILAAAFILSFSNISAQTTESKLQINHLTGNFYIYITYSLYNGYKVPANGMYLVTPKGVVLFDTPWDSTQFQPLLDSIQLRHNKKVVMCIATHFHDDRTAGLAYYKQQGIKTYTTKLTDELSKQNNEKRAEFLLAKDTLFNIGGYTFETYYPGQGHAPDNIIIWFKKERILYGACLIKSAEDKNLGNLGDANKTEYAATVKKVQAKCKQPNFVITGHGDYLHVQALQHTLMMAEELRKKSME